MEMSDYIRKAVELADGWTYHDGDCSHEETERWFIGCKLPQVWLDALAAQLVRQYYDAGRKALIWREGDPITTIKAIVDSGVLEHG